MAPTATPPGGHPKGTSQPVLHAAQARMPAFHLLIDGKSGLQARPGYNVNSRLLYIETDEYRWFNNNLGHDPMNRHCLLQFIWLIGVTVLPSRAGSIESFSLDRVRLLDGPFKHAQEVNLEHLLQYDVDRLLAPYRKEAGLEPKAESYPNWIGLDGHIGGHYLSAMAIYAAATGNAECKRRMNYMVDELAACQAANGNGYVGGVPNSRNIWSQVAGGDPVAPHKGWVPWYNLHKTFAGLRDAWIYGKNPKAKDSLIKFSDWCYDLLKDFTDDQMEAMMNQEHGGMNEVLADVSKITGDQKYLDLAKRFSHRQLLDPMSQGRDTLDNKHANTQVPKAVGFARIAELSGDQTFDKAACFFWQTVVLKRTLAFGGNSRREHFPSAGACKEMVEEREGPESCNTYNMLKLTEVLFRMHPQAKYTDYYERALYNHILSTQHPEHGGYVYFTPVRPRHYRVYSAPNQGMWCCVGTGMENHGKYGDFIYSRQDDTLFVNLFIASELDWKEKGIRVRQETRFPDEAATSLTVLTEQPVRFTLKVRHPAWVPAGQFKVNIADQTWGAESKPSSYLEINRVWKNEDHVDVTVPMHTTVEPMPNVGDYAAILHGPIVLAAETGTKDLTGLIADDQRWSHIAHGELLPLDEAPMLVGDVDSIPDKITPVGGPDSLKFTAEALMKPDRFKDLVLKPFFRVHDARYMMYWRVVSPEQYQQIAAESQSFEQERLLLDKRTMDRVIPGEQQPEADHEMKSEGSETGVYRDAFYRHAHAPGWFSYKLKVDPTTKMELMVRYWGNEAGPRTFDILIDDKKLVTENLTGQWNREKFVNVTYPLPPELVADKEAITVLFRPHPGNIAGGIYDIRILDIGSETQNRESSAALTRFEPGRDVWPDNNGVHINAHGGGVLFHEGVYYWFGEHKIAGRRGNSAQVGVHCYSSSDLYNWTDEGIALPVSEDRSSEIVRGCIIERPKVIYNAKTEKFVMWFHLELRRRGYEAARTGLAVSDNVTGPYTYLRSVRPNAGFEPVNGVQQTTMPNGVDYYHRDFEGGQMSRDMTLFVDDDDKAYHIHASEENYTLHISELTEDYLDFTRRYARVLPGGHNEAPAICKYQGRYYMITSGCTGWAPNEARSMVADNIFGPWKMLGNPVRGVNPHNGLGPEKTFGAQSTFILPVQGKKDAFIAMFDIWRPRNPIDGTYIWLPVEFINEKIIIPWRDSWDLSFFETMP